MKKLLSIAVFLMTSLTLMAQNDVTKFLGIPVDGTKADMIRKLKAKGFRNSSINDETLEGEFNGTNVYVFIGTTNNKVSRIAVLDANETDEGTIKIRYNLLCNQFKNNPKYITVSADMIPDDEKISYEMTVNKKKYQAAFCQRAQDADISIETVGTSSVNEQSWMKSVWFQIEEHYGKYAIMIFYDNEYNRAHGEDL